MSATPEGEALTEAHRRAQVLVRLETLLELRRLAPLLDVEALARTTEPWIAAATRVVVALHGRSSALARAYFRAFRLAELGTPWSGPLPETPVSREALRTSLLVTGPIQARVDTARGLDLETVAVRMINESAETAARHVLGGGRDTILGGVQTDRQALGYARVTDGKPCAFCAMLASRGPIYRTERSASFRSHNHCGCSAEPVYRTGAAWPGRGAEFADIWRSTTAGLSGRDAVNAFRRAIEAR